MKYHIFNIMDISNFLSTLRLRRKAKKHKQRDIARWSGITQAELSNIENGRVDLRISTLKRIADALDLKMIVIPKEKLEDIEDLLRMDETVSKEEPTSSLLERYGVSDDD